MNNLEYKIGDKFYLHSWSKYHENIKLVTLEFIRFKKIRGKNEHYEVYDFKCENTILKDFLLNPNSISNKYIFSKLVRIDNYSANTLNIYKLDDEFVLQKLSQLNTKEELKENIKVIENFLTEVKNSGVNAPLNTIRQITKIIKYYKYII